MSRKCTLCPKKHWAKGYCKNCYYKMELSAEAKIKLAKKRITFKRKQFLIDLGYEYLVC